MAISTAPHPFDGRPGGDLAEAAFARVNPQATRFGWDRPLAVDGTPVNLSLLPRHLREQPDYLIARPSPALVECQGFGARGEVAVKLAKVASLNAWRLFSELPVWLWLYDSSTDECGAIPVELLPDLVIGREVRTFPNGDQYVYVAKADLSCTFVALAEPIR